MADAIDRNTQVIGEFRANGGRASSGSGAPVVLVHHRGRKSGREYLTPLAYLADPDDRDTIYLFASKGGGPLNPDWYYNLTAAGRVTVELGPDRYDATVRELAGAERDRVYAEQAGRYQAFADYAVRSAGIRTIPVLELRRAS